MNATAHAVSQTLQRAPSKMRAISVSGYRLLVPTACTILLLNDVLRPIAIQALADAYWQVAAFVAATLWLFYTIERQLNGLNRLSFWMLKSRSLQIVFAATMGLFPGCGGAIIVMTQFIRGRLGFSALVAVLAATMGDAAFVLLASRPSAAAIVLPVCFASGVGMGLIVERLHPRDFMLPSFVKGDNGQCSLSEQARESTHIGGRIWKALLLPTGIIALLMAFQLDVEALMGISSGVLAPIGGGIAYVLLWSWALAPSHGTLECDGCANSETSNMFRRVADDTNFVLCWVVAGFLVFETVMLMTHLNLASLPTLPSGVVIFTAVMVGWIPGCGAQILTTSLFLTGALPMSAQLGNAISNDGDALFPALALAPRAALIATLYSTLPALVAAYGYAFFFE